MRTILCNCNIKTSGTRNIYKRFLGIGKVNFISTLKTFLVSKFGLFNIYIFSILVDIYVCILSNDRTKLDMYQNQNKWSIRKVKYWKRTVMINSLYPFLKLCLIFRSVKENEDVDSSGACSCVDYHQWKNSWTNRNRE